MIQFGNKERSEQCFCGDVMSSSLPVLKAWSPSSGRRSRPPLSSNEESLILENPPFVRRLPRVSGYFDGVVGNPACLIKAV